MYMISMLPTLYSAVTSMLSRLEQSSVAHTRMQGVRELLDANEYGVAFEILCETIDEYSIPVKQEEVLFLKEIGTAMPDKEQYIRLLDQQSLPR
jgi:hypothetical protein